MPLWSYYLIAAIICIIVLYFIATFHQTAYENYVTGNWIADDDKFCEDSGIDFMTFYVAPHEGSYTKTRECFLIIGDDICSQPVTMTYVSGWSPVLLGEYKFTASLDMPTQVMEDEVTVTVNMLTGKMSIFGSDDTCYAQLYKNHEITELTQIKK